MSLQSHLRKVVRKSLIRYTDLYPYRRYMMRHNCIYIHIPKAAGTSVLELLTRRRELYQRDHCTIHDFMRAHKKLYSQAFKFTIVRHPLDRLASAYHYLLSGGNGSTDLTFSLWLKESYPTLEEFILGYLNHSKIHQHLLLKPQHTFLYSAQDELLVDYLGRFESLEEDIVYVQKRLNLSKQMPHKNKGSKKCELALSEAAKQRVYLLYQKDFELLGYRLNQ